MYIIHEYGNCFVNYIYIVQKCGYEWEICPTAEGTIYPRACVFCYTFVMVGFQVKKMVGENHVWVRQMGFSLGTLVSLNRTP